MRKIPFSSITGLEKDIKLLISDDSCNVALDGVLFKKDRDFAVLKAKIEGFIKLDCDICTKEFNEQINEEIELKISNQPQSSKNSNSSAPDYDIIEFLDNQVDIEDILFSEINAIRYDYRKCTECQED